MRRVALDIKKKILELLKQKSRTYRELESKINTNYTTIKTQVKELEFFGLVKVTKHDRNDKNGRAFSIVELIKNK